MVTMKKVMEEAQANPAVLPNTAPYIDLSLFEGKPKVSHHVEVQWVWNCLDVEVSIEDAPSAGAWALLQHVRAHPFNRQKFYDGFATKLLPPKNKLDQDGRHEDDGREQLKILDAVEREMVKSGDVCPTCEGKGRV